MLTNCTHLQQFVKIAEIGSVSLTIAICSEVKQQWLLQILFREEIHRQAIKTSAIITQTQTHHYFATHAENRLIIGNSKTNNETLHRQSRNVYNMYVCLTILALTRSRINEHQNRKKTRGEFECVIIINMPVTHSQWSQFGQILKKTV